MPEIGEIARIVNRLRTHLVGRTISKVTALEDRIVFKDTACDAFTQALEGKTVLAAKQWGKYFWLVMDSPPHPLMHFGMTGWIHIRDDPGAHYRTDNKKTQPDDDWPPRHLKFSLRLTGTSNELAFTDPRRLSRIRLIDHSDGNDLRSVAPLSANGPDPVLAPIELVWMAAKLRSRKLPVKAWLLDQAAIAGVGNWVGDEILWNARIHPEAHTNTLSDAQVAELHRALLYVTKFAVDVEADSSRFPADWLMLHRWGKGKAGGVRLPTGEPIDFVKVGSRTSAFVPSLQKKGAGVKDEEGSGAGDVTPKKVGGRVKARAKRGFVEEDGSEVEDVPKKVRGRAKKEEDESEVEDVKPKKNIGRTKRAKKEVIEEDEESEFEEKKPKPKAKGRNERKKAVKEEEEEKEEEEKDLNHEEEDVKPVKQELEAPEKGKGKVESSTRSRGHPRKVKSRK